MTGHETVETQRSHVRIKVFLSATLAWDGQTTTIRVRDIGRHGLAADSSNPPPRGATVQFKRGEVERSARVVWAKGNRFGLRFERPMSAEDELHIHFPPGSEESARTPAPAFRWTSRYGR